jgi:DNA adenine methylase
MGGINQKGKYKIDCRFNKKTMIESIRLISKYKDRVEVYNMDAKELIKYLNSREKHLFYNFDPPYVNNGIKLYLNAFELQDHIDLRDEVKNVNTEWIMTYDNVELIKDLYEDFTKKEFDLLYSICNKRKEKELFISNMLAL